MNCLIVLPTELQSPSTAVLTGPRVGHATELHALSAGVEVRAALLGGKRGSALVKSVRADRVELELNLTLDPWPRREVSWIVGVSRPPTIKKVVQLAAVLGVTRLDLIRTSNTEKSYLQSPVLAPEQLQIEVLKGLEQSGDSVAPRIEVHRFFDPFVKQTLDSVAGDCWKVIADTRASQSFHSLTSSGPHLCLAIGPEPGWSEREVAIFAEHGFETANFGVRAVRVETAVLYATAYLEGLCTRK